MSKSRPGSKRVMKRKSPSMNVFDGQSSLLDEDITTAFPSPSPSASSTLVVKSDLDPKADILFSDMPPPKTDADQEDDSKTTTPTPPPSTVTTSANGTSKKPPPPGPQLIGHLPTAREEAFDTFVEIPANHYQYSTLGRSREALESMTCDCQYEHGVDSPGDACGQDSDCINRLTQVECLPDDCRCRSYCQNQRFQNKQYADIEIVQTEKKGFGLRAEKDLRRDTFIYEYVGDVVNQPSFKKRMRDYADEGIRHFYFMMLQKDEFIDATKRGGIGRFANHSCNPNCYVAKWTVGQHVRMGIFAKRNIKKDEELTFNYNVDRYGHEAQPCYCGEPKCVGYIGGKTQTDIATMDDLYLDALGITDEGDRQELKGTKKKRGKKVDDPDFMPILKPIVEKEVPKVVQAMRQTQSRKVLYKLLTRIKITEDQAALRQIMRLRGFSLMTNILDDYLTDAEMVILALQSISTWPLLARNKVDDSKVNVPVEACAMSDNEDVKTLAQKLLDHWGTLPSTYRIPKRVIQEGEHEPIFAPTPVFEDDEIKEPQPKRSRYYEYDFTLRAVHRPTTPPAKASVTSWEYTMGKLQKQKESIAAILAEAHAKVAADEAAAEAAAAAAAAIAAAAATESPDTSMTEDKAERKKHRPSKKHQTPEEKEANKEKRLLKLVGQVVVKCMSKYSKSMDHDLFKKHAKELTQIIADKEKKSSSYREGRLDALSDEKVVKIKKFAKEYIIKVLRKLEKSGQRRRLSSIDDGLPVASTSANNTPNSANGGDTVMTDANADNVMDMDSDRQSDNDDQEMDGEPDGDEQDRIQGTPPEGDVASSSRTEQRSPGQASDPRRRPPHRDKELGWEPHKYDREADGADT